MASGSTLFVVDSSVSEAAHSVAVPPDNESHPPGRLVSQGDAVDAENADTDPATASGDMEASADVEGLIPLCTRHPLGPHQSTATFGYDIAQMKNRPWAQPGAKLSDYFNYGFNEQSWRAYCQLQLEGEESLRQRADELLQMLQVTSAANQQQQQQQQFMMMMNNNNNGDNNNNNNNNAPGSVESSGLPPSHHAGGGGFYGGGRGGGGGGGARHQEENPYYYGAGAGGLDHPPPPPRRGGMYPSSHHVSRYGGGSGGDGPDAAGPHHPHNMLGGPPSRGGLGGGPGSRYKTQLCQRFIEGRCAHGENCNYAHGEAELRPTPPGVGPGGMPPGPPPGGMGGMGGGYRGGGPGGKRYRSETSYAPPPPM